MTVVTFAVGFAPMGCYIVREEDGKAIETVRVGVKTYREAVKIAERMEREAASNPEVPRDA